MKFWDDMGDRILVENILTDALDDYSKQRAKAEAAEAESERKQATRRQKKVSLGKQVKMSKADVMKTMEKILDDSKFDHFDGFVLMVYRQSSDEVKLEDGDLVVPSDMIQEICIDPLTLSVWLQNITEDLSDTVKEAVKQAKAEAEKKKRNESMEVA